MFKVIGGLGVMLLIVGLIPHPDSPSTAISLLLGSILTGGVVGAIADNLNLIGD